MAQAARLSSRMQKELKLLLSDPPPGASFPILSDDCSSSLTAIDALLEGPQGTVYSNGVFKIRIQIPERYPFQPPAVTFATPIYHPNIDTGGRICLDILNLPPKGTWQPSLNISTVLTSIGLLLSEPNPDDGLMHEASREYKYNRQVFDQIARSMTEKHARVGESECSGATHVAETRTGPSTSHAETQGSDAEKFQISCNNNLSLKSMQSSHNSKSEKDIHKEADSDSTTKFNEGLGKSQTMRNKMSLSVSRIRNGSQCSSMLEVKTTSDDPPESCDEKLQSFSVPTSHNPCKRVATSGVIKKVGPQTHSEDEKENTTPVQETANGVMHGSERRARLVDKSNEKQQIKCNDKFQQDNEEGLDMTEAVVVLDSEDEDVPVRSKLKLPRRCLSRKRKGNLPSYR